MFIFGVVGFCWSSIFISEKEGGEMLGMIELHVVVGGKDSVPSPVWVRSRGIIALKGRVDGSGTEVSLEGKSPEWLICVVETVEEVMGMMREAEGG